MNDANENPRACRIAGWALTGLAGAFLIFETVIKLMVIGPVTESMRKLGYPEHQAFGLGVMEAIIVVLLLVPRTALLGAVLLTGMLGGAAASHLRVENPLFSHILFGTYLGLMVWGGLYLREPRLRALMPWRR